MTPNREQSCWALLPSSLMDTVSEERRRQRRRRYLSIGTGELSAAGIFTFLAVTVVIPSLPGPNTPRAVWSALLPLLFILVQGGSYWLLARSWVGRGVMPRSMAAFYRALTALNPVLLLSGLGGVLVWWPGRFGAVVATAIWLFGVVEYLNYFVVRLSYPLTRWFSVVGQWRTPQLVRDIRESTAHTTVSARNRPRGGQLHQ